MRRSCLRSRHRVRIAHECWRLPWFLLFPPRTRHTTAAIPLSCGVIEVTADPRGGARRPADLGTRTPSGRESALGAEARLGPDEQLVERALGVALAAEHRAEEAADEAERDRD